MKLLTQKPGEQRCLLYCAAMLLDLDVETIINHLGTDGQDIWWPMFEVPRCYRGIHIQEIQDVFISYGKILAPIEKFPMLSPTEDERLGKPIYDVNRCEMRFYARLIGVKGLLIYKTHAKALDFNAKIYDPNGEISEITIKESSLCREAWLMGTL